MSDTAILYIAQTPITRNNQNFAVGAELYLEPAEALELVKIKAIALPDDVRQAAQTSTALAAAAAADQLVPQSQLSAVQADLVKALSDLTIAQDALATNEVKLADALKRAGEAEAALGDANNRVTLLTEQLAAATATSAPAAADAPAGDAAAGEAAAAAAADAATGKGGKAAKQA